MEAIYQRACPSCGGDVERSRLMLGLHCSECRGEQGLMKWMRDLEGKYEEFLDFLEENYGIEPWGPQRAWIKWLLSGEDVVLSAPTGTGKSTTLAAYASFMAKEGKRVLYVVPSRSLVKQVEKLVKGVDVTTSAKMIRTPEEFKGYDIIIIDDVDAAMKSEKTVEAVLKIVGLEEEAEKAKRAAKLLIKAMKGDEKAMKEYVKLKSELVRARRKKRAQLIFSSATHGKPGLVAKLMLLALGLSPSSFPPAVREVKDVKMRYDDLKELVDVVKEFLKSGYGGAVFVYEGGPKEEVLRILRENGIKAEEAKAGSIKAIERFERGEVEVLVASASRYGVLARGIDIPERFRFAVFLEPPHKSYTIEKASLSPFMLAKMLDLIGMKDEAVEVGKLISRLSPAESLMLSAAMRGEVEVDGKLRSIMEKLMEIRKELLEKAKGVKVAGKGLVIKDGKVFKVDHVTYLQASGRASRLTKEGFTKGVSVVLYSDEDLMKALEESLRGVLEFGNELILPKGKVSVEVESALLVVESPTKAKTIARILGGGSAINVGEKVYQAAARVGDKVYFLYIFATKGHLFDLTVDGVGVHGILIGNEVVPVYGPINKCKECGYSWSGSPGRCPRCGGEAESSLKRIEVLRRLSYIVDTVIVASDPDEEGEKIAWDVEAMVKPFNRNVRRARYYEVTRRGILSALSELQDVDYGIVKSQIVRRIDDRLVGFEVSQLLWSKFGSRNLGMGRVQGPVLKWAVEAKKLWDDNKGYAVTLELENGDKIVIFRKDKEEALKIASLKKVKISEVTKEVRDLSPLPPLTTDELLREASSRGLGPRAAMTAAQRLFEQGLITYHRTDSTRVSDVGIAIAKEWIANNFGEEEFVPRRWGEGGAHEAIRPTKALDLKSLLSSIAAGTISAKLDKYQMKVYKIVFERFIASQMKEAQVEFAKVKYLVDSEAVTKEHPVKVVSEGWTKVRPIKVFEGRLEVGEVKVVKSYVRRASRFRLPTAGEIVKRMREAGIGRPSTYTRTIEALRRHGYVVLSKYRGAVVATKRGIKVLEYLEELMPELLSESYTRSLEELMEQAPDRYEEILNEIVGKVWKVREAAAGTLLS
ncbi:hypothetical protein IPA_09000 [Ignicoccus pacificus DSM 13166]|uniref:Reverse gyrase n=1 Tax=Ignicoccus pacificus DSM 13166 TaxID=940294 RepID=A0A977KCQ6_9CREN|nr:hypothetical protein IPA_09000 [Ignicoccus pacificus DSM 13166]